MVFWQPDRCFPSGKILETFVLRQLRGSSTRPWIRSWTTGFDLETP